MEGNFLLVDGRIRIWIRTVQIITDLDPDPGGPKNTVLDPDNWFLLSLYWTRILLFCLLIRFLSLVVVFKANNSIAATSEYYYMMAGQRFCVVCNVAMRDPLFLVRIHVRICQIRIRLWKLDFDFERGKNLRIKVPFSRECDERRIWGLWRWVGCRVGPDWICRDCGHVAKRRIHLVGTTAPTISVSSLAEQHWLIDLDQ